MKKRFWLWSIWIWIVSGMVYGAGVEVVTTFSIIEDWVREVGGGRVHVVNLVGRGEDIHGYEMKPQGMGSLERASLVFEVGLGLEGWFKNGREYYKGKKGGKLVTLGEGVPVKLVAKGRGCCGGVHGGEVDPHVWMNLENVKVMVMKIGEALGEVDPDYAEQYEARGAQYIAKLEQLDGRIKKMVEGVEVGKRVLVTNHDFLSYFAKGYDFRVVGVIYGVDSHDSEVGAGKVMELLKLIRDNNVTTLFSEVAENQDIALKLIEEGKLRPLVLMNTCTLSGQADDMAGNYLGMMELVALKVVNGIK